MSYFCSLIIFLAILRMTKSYERIFPPPRLPIFAGNKTRTPDRIETIRTDCIVAKWVCDVCRTASFDDYDEACRHEGECGGGVRMTAAAAVAARGKIESGENGYFRRPVSPSSRVIKPAPRIESKQFSPIVLWRSGCAMSDGRRPSMTTTRHAGTRGSVAAV